MWPQTSKYTRKHEEVQRYLSVLLLLQVPYNGIQAKLMGLKCFLHCRLFSQGWYLLLVGFLRLSSWFMGTYIRYRVFNSKLHLTKFTQFIWVKWHTEGCKSSADPRLIQCHSLRKKCQTLACMHIANKNTKNIGNLKWRSKTGILGLKMCK